MSARKCCFTLLMAALFLVLAAAAQAEFTVGAEIGAGDITDFYYTVDASTYPPHYQRWRFYTEDGKRFFYHETREGGGWP